MKKMLAVICCAVFTLSIIGCEEMRKQEKANIENAREQQLQELPNKVVGDIQYVKDLRTNFCFAFYQNTSPDHYKESIATVPCEAIPPQLLLVAKKIKLPPVEKE